MNDASPNIMHVLRIIKNTHLSGDRERQIPATVLNSLLSMENIEILISSSSSSRHSSSSSSASVWATLNYAQHQ